MGKMTLSNYNLITPVRNEEDHLLKLAKCVINQSHLPEVWVIVDHKSLDRSPEIIKKLTENYSWIYSIRYDEEGTGHGIPPEVYNLGIKESLRLSSDVKYIVKIDADMRFHYETLEEIIKKAQKNDNLVITAPGLITLKREIGVDRLKNPEDILNDDNIVISRTKKDKMDMPFDGFRVFRKNFLEEVDRIPNVNGGHHIIKGKALERGYEVSYVDEWVYMTREMGKDRESTHGKFGKGKKIGFNLYFRQYHPILIFARLLYDFAQNPLHALGEVVGYFESFINQEERIKDPEVIRHYRRGRFKKMLEWLK